MLLVIYDTYSMTKMQEVTMNQSPEIDKLAEALSLFLGEVQDAHRNQKAHNYDYADLSQILDICRPLLCKYKLSVAQLPVPCGSEFVLLQTKLMHISGQWIESEMGMPVEGGKGMSRAQQMGSILTYLRRYTLAAMLGLTQTDNDASIVESITVETYARLIELMEQINAKPEDRNRWLAKFKASSFTKISEPMALGLIEALKKKVSVQERPLEIVQND